MKLKWFGHSCFEIESEGIKLLIDPFISQNPSSCTGVTELNPDIIAVTHGHWDHFGDTVDIALRTGCTVVCIHEISQYLKSRGIKTIGQNIGGKTDILGFTLIMTDALHSSSLDEAGQGFYAGRAAGFIIKAGGFSVYHAGDTGLFREMGFISKLYSPDIAILPIGGRYTMDPEDAALAVEMLRPEIVIPMHYNTFSTICQDPSVFAEYVKAVSNADVHIMEVGDELIL